VTNPDFSTDYTEWKALLAACESYATLSGWRFVLADFMRMDRRETPGMAEARERAMPMALEFADRARACAAAVSAGAEPPRLYSEFQVCQRYVAREAVYNSMIATIAAVGLGEAGSSASAGGESDADDPERFAFHDMTQPVEVIARRLLAYNAHVEGSPEAAKARHQRLLHASFVVEFGLEHGLPDFRDTTSEGMLRDFLERLGEWEGGRNSETVRALVLQSIPPGPANRGLRQTALDWAEENRTSALVGGALLGGLAGMLAATAVVAIASSRRGK